MTDLLSIRILYRLDHLHVWFSDIAEEETNSFVKVFFVKLYQAIG